MVSWLRKKQSLVSLSTVEVEYIAATTCYTQVLWMKQNLTDIQVEYVGTKEQVANIFTKPLPREAFEYLCQRLGFISTPKMNSF